MGKLYQWMRRLQQFLGGEDSEPREVRDTGEKAANTYGRFESEKRKSESRIMYQYPKTGQFRFPIIEDAPIRKKRNEDHVQVRKAPRNEEQVQARKASSKEEKIRPIKQESKKFSETGFKLTSIPSPVYGFMERETTKSVMGDNLSVLPFEKKKEDQLNTQSEMMERVLERAEEENSMNQIHDEPIWNVSGANGLIQANEKTYDLTQESTFHSEEKVEFKSELEREIDVPQELDSIYKLVDSRLLDEDTNALEQVSSVPPYESKKVGSAAQEDASTAKEEVAATVQEDVSTAKEEVAATVQGEPATADKKEFQERSEQTTAKELTNEKKDIPVKVQENKLKKPAIPFNVMMLPQDKPKKQIPQNPVADSSYVYPSIQLLNYPALKEEDESEWLKEQGEILEETLLSFHVDAKVVHVTKGPSVTRFEIQPGRGVKVTKITGLTDDMKLALAAKDIRIEAPIPGKNTIGIEVPNRNSTPVFLREILRRNVFVRSESSLTVALGLDISGQPIVTDLKKMPHGLVAGATGSGKSVCINSVLISLLFKATPDEVKLLLIDPKMVELAPYNGLPHLVTPVITDAKQATAALKWVVLEMERRYELFSQKGVRDVGRYNDIYSETPDKPALPFILVVIDELADLMMVSPQEVEDSICRIAQKARACGIHLLLATQRPSVDVITGLIKANIPTRIAFSVSSQTDSRTILDMGGAERLLGRGDMLFHENGSPKPVRVQGTFVSDQEIEDVVAHVKKQREPEYLLETEQLKHVTEEVDDEHFEEACYFVIDHGSASASSLQRKFRVGYNRAARLIDLMEERGIVSQAMGSKPRHVLVDTIELEEILHYQEG